MPNSRYLRLDSFLYKHRNLYLTLHRNAADDLFVYVAGGDEGVTKGTAFMMREEVPGYWYEVKELPGWGWVIILHPETLEDLLEMGVTVPETSPFQKIRDLYVRKQNIEQERVPAAMDDLDVKLALMIEGGREV